MLRTLGFLPLLLIAMSVSLADDKYTIAVIGTGNMGSALGQQLAGAGYIVVYGSRNPSRETED